jgi:hypothetical protein
MKQFGVLWAGDAEIVDDWLPEAIADLIDPRLGARFVEIATGRTTDAERGLRCFHAASDLAFRAA